MVLNPLRLTTRMPDFDAAFAACLELPEEDNAQRDAAVAAILRAVRLEGDAAVLRYAAELDHSPFETLSQSEISLDECQAALAGLNAPVRNALVEAAQRIRQYHERQRLESWQYVEADGTRLGQEIRALDRVGLYVPGGRAAYPSSLLMNAVPAKVAGVAEIIMVTPTPGGVRNPSVLAAAAVAGVDRVFAIGGAHAVAALAYGTASVPAVDKIVGPGNAYVASAKRQVFGRVGIDMIAGPSEILVLSDGSAPADWIAMDLFAQAEHDELAQAIVVSPDAAHLEAVLAAAQRLLPTLPRANTICESLNRRGAFIEVRDLDEACALANRMAPEHLELALLDAAAWVPRIRHAGAIFVGAHSSESLGDYCAGPNHVLPTSGTARYSSPLGVYDFQKRSSLIDVSPEGARRLGALAATLADTEGLQAHAASARLRLEKGA